MTERLTKVEKAFLNAIEITPLAEGGYLVSVDWGEVPEVYLGCHYWNAVRKGLEKKGYLVHIPRNKRMGLGNPTVKLARFIINRDSSKGGLTGLSGLGVAQYLLSEESSDD